MACFSCHSINGRGGDMAPNLTWEGTSVQRAWLVNFLKNPNTLRPALIRRMPQLQYDRRRSEHAGRLHHDGVPDSGIRSRCASLRAIAGTLPKSSAARGLFYGKYACQSCHIVDPAKDKGYIGPTLDAGGYAAECRLDLSLVEERAELASWIA